MIDDLFTDLTIGRAERLLAPGTSSHDVDMAMARLNARLTRGSEPDERVRDERAGFGGPEANQQLLTEYLRLAESDLLQIPAPVHEWLLERLSAGDLGLALKQFPTVWFIYRSFPGTTVRHAVVGLPLQADIEKEWRERVIDAPAEVFAGYLSRDESIPAEAQLSERRTFVDLLLDFADAHTEATLRALAAALSEWRDDDLVRQHLRESAQRIGGEVGRRVAQLA